MFKTRRSESHLERRQLNERRDKRSTQPAPPTDGGLLAFADLPSAFSEKWIAKQKDLQNQLKAFSDAPFDYSVDLAQRKLTWVSKESKPKVIADVKVIATWAHSSRSLLFGWANRSFPPAATIDALEGFPRGLPNKDDHEAFWIAIQIADRVGAEFIYKAPGRQTDLYLAVWNVRAASEEMTEVAQGGPPWPFMLRLTQQLRRAIDDGRPISTLAGNYALEMRENTHEAARRFQKQRDIFVKRLLKIAKQDPEPAAKELEKLQQKVRVWSNAASN